MIEKEAIRQAWLANDRAALFAIIDFRQADWRSRAGHLLTVFEEEGVELRMGVSLAHDFESKLSQSGQLTLSDSWRSVVAPRILQLQSGASFVDSNLVVLTTAVEPILPTQLDWIETAQWLDVWNTHNLVAATAAQPIHDLKVLKDRGILPPALYKRAPIFHPLILFSMRVRLRESKFSSVALPLCQWLVDNVFVTPHPQVTLATVFATGPLILDMVNEFHGDIVGISTPSQLEWRQLEDTVVTTIVTNSVGTPNVLPPWRGQQDTVRELVDACSYWHAPKLAGVLRGRATPNLRHELNEIKVSLTAQSAELSKKGLMPEKNGQRIFVAKPQDYARRPLPNFRGATTATWNQDSARQPYANVLQMMDDSSRRLAAATSAVQDIANNLVAKRKAFERELGNPWMQAALPDYLQDGLEDLVVDNHTMRHFLKAQLEMARVDFRVYDNGRLIVDTPAWSTAVNIQAEAATMLAAWARLEVWDKLRGRMLADAQVDAEAISRILADELDAKWKLDVNEPAPAEETLDTIRPLLAATAHLGLASDKMASCAGVLDQYLKETELEEAQFTALAAMRLELGITMVITGIPIGIAFPQITSGLETILGWAGRCLASKNAWEARAGMNMFNLLARLAETSDDLVFTTPLASAIVPAKGIIEQSIAFIKDGKPVPGSDLALTFAASDLLRYTRGRAVGISGLDVQPVWWSSGDIGELIDDLIESYTEPDKLSAIQTTAGLPTQLLLLALTHIKLEQYARERQLAVWPQHSGGRGLAHQMQFVRLETLRNLKASLRSLCCQAPILLRGLPPAHIIFTVRTPLQPGDKWTLKTADAKIIEYQANAQTITAKDVVDGLARAWRELNGAAPAGWVLRADPSPNDGFADLIFEQLTNASPDLALVTTSQGGISTLTYTQDNVPWWETPYWASVYAANDADLTDDHLEPLPGREPIFRFVNWADAFQYDALADLLATAAALEDAFPDHPTPLTGDIFAATPDLLRDIDGRYEGEFNQLAIGAAQKDLKAFVDTLKEAEGRYEKAILELTKQERHNQVLEHLKQPLRFATVDFKQQIEVALAEVRAAEAELEAAEHDSLAAGFEQFAAELLVEAAKLEVRRQEVLVVIEAKKGEIAQLKLDVEQINWDVEIINGDIATKQIEQANQHIARAQKQEEIAATARGFIIQEIDLVLGLIGVPEGHPDAEKYRHPVKVKDQNDQKIDLGFANGRIGVMALQTQYTLSTKLRGELEKAEYELREAERRERKAKKKAKRNKLIKSACRFIGAVVGAVIGGGPAGAALGAEIGEAMAEVAIGVMDNRPPGEILVGLVDNAYSIAGAAGYNLETALNDLGTKVGNELTGYLDKLEANLEPIFDSLPKVVDKQLFQDTLEVLDLKEIAGIGPLLNGALDGLKTDLRGLKNLGTVLKDSVAFDSVDQFKKHLADQLLKNTNTHVNELEAIAKKVGITWKDLQNDPVKQRETMERFGSLVLVNMASKVGEHRSGILQRWIAEKKSLGADGYWDKVKEEGEALLRDLFPDANALAKAKANVAAALLNPETHRGLIQQHLKPWQDEFDKRLNAIMAPEDGGAPGTEVEAWRQQVTHLRSAIEQFEGNNGLFAWMNGKNNEQIEKLHGDLKKLQQADELQRKRVEIDEIDVNLAQGDLEIVKQELARARKDIAAAEKSYRQSELGVEIASLNNQVTDLARMKAITEEEMKVKSAQAAQERQKAATARVKAAQAVLEAAKASLKAAQRRGGEAGRILNALAMPPLALPDVAGVAARQARHDHDEALKNALSAYREVLRFCFSVEVSNIPAPGRSDLSVANGDATWAKALMKWNDDVSQTLQDQQVVTTIEDTFEYDLTAAQIKSLMSPDGLRLVVGSGLDEKPVIMRLDKPFADTLKVGSVNAEWRQALNNVGVAVSEQAKFEAIPNEPGQFWLSDPKFKELRVNVFQAITGEKDGAQVGGWTIPLSPNTYKDRSKYRVQRDAQSPNVVVRWEPSPKLNAGRSCLPGAIVVSMPKPLAVRTGRIVGVFLGIKDRNDAVIGGDTYDMSVMFQGAAWQKDDYLEMREKRKLPQNRVIYEGATPERSLTMLLNRMGMSETDLRSFKLEGTPLWGTTVIRLTGEATDIRPFEQAKLRLVYKWYSWP